jgi:hypothetical protein
MRAAVTLTLSLLSGVCLAAAPPDVTITERMQKPAAAVDVSRLTNPGLPPDLALPRVRACAVELLAGRPVPSGALRVTLRVSASGAVEGVDARADAADPVGAPIPPTLVACARERLASLRLQRARGAAPIVLAGAYRFVAAEAGLVVVGRVRERAP